MSKMINAGYIGATGAQGHTGPNGLSGENTYPSWAPSTLYAIGSTSSHLGLLFRCISAHTSSSSFASDLARWDVETPEALMLHGVTISGDTLAPVYFSSGSWLLAVATSSGTLATHIILLKNSTDTLLVSRGHFSFTHGKATGTWYTASALGATTNVVPSTGYVNPLYFARTSTDLDVLVGQYPSYYVGGGSSFYADGFIPYQTIKHTGAVSAANYSVAIDGETYPMVKIIVSGHSTVAGIATITMTVNNDSGNNYPFQTLQGTTTAASATNSTGSSISVLSAYNSTGNSSSSFFNIQGDLRSGRTRRFLVQGGDSTNSNRRTRLVDAAWGNTVDPVVGLDFQVSIGVVAEIYIFARK